MPDNYTLGAHQIDGMIDVMFATAKDVEVGDDVALEEDEPSE
jgi:hypothetical protein